MSVKSYLGRSTDNYPIIHHRKGLVTRAFSIFNRLTTGLLARSLYLPPSFIQIEPTTKCNLRCTSCLRTRTYPDMSSDMSMDTFKTIIDRVLSPLLVKPVTKLFGLGEPLLNPRISSMVQYAKRKGLEVDLVSNFTFLSQDISEKLIEAQLDSMCVSLDSASPEIFEKIRVGAKLDEVIRNVELFLRIRKDMNSTKPQIFFNSTINRDNFKEIPGIVKLAKNVGVDGVNFANQIVPGTAWYDYPLFETLRFGKTQGEADVWVQEEASICPAPRRCYITFDGKVMPCNFLMEIIPREKYLKFEFGDITQNSFSSIWFSTRYQQFRIRKALGFHPYFCNSCPCLNAITKRKTYSLTN